MVTAARYTLENTVRPGKGSALRGDLPGAPALHVEQVGGDALLDRQVAQRRVGRAGVEAVRTSSSTWSAAGVSARSAFVTAARAVPELQPGTIAVTAEVDGQALTLTIADDGRWRHRPARLGGGVGLALIRATADATIVDSGPRGTTIQLRWDWS